MIRASHWAFLLCLPLSVQAGRPLFVDDAEPVAPGALEIEAGVARAEASSEASFDVPIGAAFGVLPGLEVGFGFGGLWLDSGLETVGGWSDVSLGSKLILLRQDQAGADHAFAVSISFPTADRDRGLGSGELDCAFTYVASRALTDGWNAHLNLGYLWLGEVSDQFAWGVATDVEVVPNWSLVAEVYGIHETRGHNAFWLLANGGVRWAMAAPLVVDAAVGTSLNREAPDWFATVGVTWTLQVLRPQASLSPVVSR